MRGKKSEQIVLQKIIRHCDKQVIRKYFTGSSSEKTQTKQTFHTSASAILYKNNKIYP